MEILFKLFASFFKIGAFSFGGGYAMLPLIKKEIIEVHGWLTNAEFIDILAISEMTPGPIAINSATFLGYRVSGWWFNTGHSCSGNALLHSNEHYYPFLSKFKIPNLQIGFLLELGLIVLGLIASAAISVALMPLSI